MKVVPAILTDDINSFWDQINKLLPFYKRFHIDIFDGTINKSEKTVSLKDILDTSNKQAETIKIAEFSFHFLVKNNNSIVQDTLELKKILNIKTLYFHVKKVPNIKLLYAKTGINIGLVVELDNRISEFLTKYGTNGTQDIIIMTIVSRAQGLPFHEYPLNKIEQLRNAGYRYNISVDGGINENTIPLILSKKFKPDFLDIGSYFSKAEDLAKNISSVKKLLAAS